MTTGLSNSSESILMPVPIKPKKTVVPGRIPSTADLSLGEVCINYADIKIYGRHPQTGAVLQLTSPPRNEIPAILVHAVDGNDLFIGRLEWDDYPASGPAEDSTAWTIYKISTNSAGDVLSEQSAAGAWSSKETLTYL
jgi:hypothetical protein